MTRNGRLWMKIHWNERIDHECLMKKRLQSREYDLSKAATYHKNKKHSCISVVWKLHKRPHQIFFAMSSGRGNRAFQSYIAMSHKGAMPSAT
jgi:hypothetical protein